MKKIISMLTLMFMLFYWGDISAQENLNQLEESDKTLLEDVDDIIEDIRPDDPIKMTTELEDVIVDMDFENVTMEKVSDNTYKVEMDIINHHTAVLPNFIYGVRLIDSGNEGNVVWEKNFTDDSVTISPQSAIHKQFTFSMPDYLGGEFIVEFAGATKEGIYVEFYRLPNNITLTRQSDEYIDIQDCSFFINNKEQFPLQNGVDVGPSEKLTIVCDITNKSNNKVLFTPNLKLYRKTMADANLVNLPAYAPVEIAVDSSRPLTIEIPVDKLDTDYYDALLTLTKDGRDISNIQKAHFVIQGQSGSIASANFNESKYSKGDTFKAKIDIAGAADMFPGSRASKRVNREGIEPEKLFLISSLISNETKCAKDYKDEVPSVGVTTVVIEQKIEKDCLNPKVVLTLTDANNKTLDIKEYDLKQTGKAVTTTDKDQNNTSQSQSQLNNTTITLIALVVLLIVLIVFVIFWVKMIIRKKNKNNNILSIILLPILAGGIFIISSQVTQAGKLTVCSKSYCYQDKGKEVCLDKGYCSYDISPTSVCQNGDITATTSMSWAVCNNHPDKRYVTKWKIDGSKWTTLVDVKESRIDHCYGCVDNGHCSGNDRLYSTKHGSGHCTVSAYNQGRKQANGKKCIKDSKCTKNYYTIPDNASLDGRGNKKVSGKTGKYTAYFLFQWKDEWVDVVNKKNKKLQSHSQSLKDFTGKKTYTVKSCYKCTGTRPPGSTICPGTDTGLNKNTPWHKVSDCSGASKCAYTKKAQCGSAHEGSFTTLSSNNPNLCGLGQVSDFDDTMSELDGVWEWKCVKSGYDTASCLAHKYGDCAPMTQAPYENKEDACKEGHINQVYFDGTTFKWKCGTNNSNNPGSFDDVTLGAQGTTFNLVSDTYTPTPTKCQCTADYTYFCQPTSVDCTDKCGQTVNQVHQALKKETGCFPNESKYLSITQAEYNQNKGKHANGHPDTCENKPVQCPPCGTNPGETGPVVEY